MKIIDYRPSDENIFIVANDQNYLNVIQNEETVIFNSQDPESETIHAKYVCFSYDGDNIVYVNEPLDLNSDTSKLTIMEYSELFEINIDGGRIINCAFITDGEIINYKLSPNNNHIAILFTCRETYSDTINGVKTISDGTLTSEYQYKNILHVYDFTPGHQRLIFHKIYNEDNEIIFSLSEINTIAIVSYGEDLDEDDVGDYSEICVYDLPTGNKSMQKYLRNDIEYSVNLIQYYPELVTNNNHLVLITKSSNGEKNMRILDLENDFREIYNKSLNRDIVVHSIAINYNGNIALGTDNGLDFYHSLEPGDEDFDKLFVNDTIVDISFTTNSEKVAVATMEYNERLRNHINIFKIFDFNQNTIIYNSNDDADYESDEEFEQEEQHIYIPGVAFEIHNAFHKINLPNLVGFLDSSDIEPIEMDASSVERFLQNINSIFSIYINAHFSEASPEKKSSLIDHLDRVLGQIRGIDFDYEMESIGMLRWEFLRLIISFVMKQEVNFVENYLDTFIEDSYRAYSSAAGDDANISCPKGIIERFVLCLHTASVLLCPENFSTCPSPYKELIRLLCSAVEVHINWGELQQDWYRSGIAKIPFESRKQNFIDYMKHRANEICPDDSITIEKIEQDADIWEAADLFSDENVQTFQEGGNVWLSYKYFI
jgi:hypothetical protein